MVKAIAAMAVLWPLVAAAAVTRQVAGTTDPWVTVLYLAASHVCHQQPARSFHTVHVQWPVCARCSGLYLGGAAGALIALPSARRRRWARGTRGRWVLMLASVPTAMAWGLEASGAPMTNVLRAISALPLGAAIAAAILVAASGTVRNDQVN